MAGRLGYGDMSPNIERELRKLAKRFIELSATSGLDDQSFDVAWTDALQEAEDENIKEARKHGYLTPGSDPSMPSGGPPVYHGPEERYGGRRDVRVRGYERRMK